LERLARVGHCMTLMGIDFACLRVRHTFNINGREKNIAIKSKNSKETFFDTLKDICLLSSYSYLS